MKTKILSMLIFIVIALMSVAGEKLVFRDDFTNPSSTGINPDFKTATDSSGLKYLECRTEKPGPLYPQWELKRSDSKSAWENYEADFKFRFPEEGKKSFSVPLYFGNGKYSGRIVFYESNCSFSPYSEKQNWISSRFEAYGIPKLKKDEWRRAVIRVTKKEFGLFIEHAGKLQCIMSGDVPDTPCGFNINIAKDAVDLSDLQVRELPPPPHQAFRTENGLKVAQYFSSIEVPAPTDSSTVSFKLLTGPMRPGPKINLSWDDKKDFQISTNVLSANASIKVTENKTSSLKDVLLDDYYIQYAITANGWANINQYVRPNMIRYKEDQQSELYARWSKMPGASTRAAQIELKRNGKGWELWIDSCYCYLLEKNAPIRNIRILLPAGAGISDPICGKSEDFGNYLPLNMAHIAAPSTMKDMVVSMPELKKTLGKVPMKTAENGSDADIGAVKECQGLKDLETDADLARSPLDGMPEHKHYSVPLEQYIRAWVLCAADDDPKKDPVLTARLTRFTNGGRGESIADTSITLPRGSEKPEAGITKAGTVSYSVQGGKVTVPLWLCEIKLKTGEIQDLLWGDRNGILPMKGEYLDFEFLGKLDIRRPGNDRSHKPDPKSVSAVHVFGVTLEKSPVELEVKKTQVANAFHNDDKPEMQVALRPRCASECRLKWEIRDIDGKVVGGNEEKVNFTSGSEQTLTVPLGMKELGWYGIDFTLTDKDGRELVRHPASFVLLGKDTRKAGYESPYMSWWFGFAHLGSPDPNIGGPILLKMGVRRTTFSWHSKDLNEENLAPWKLTLSQIGWMGRHYRSNNWIDGPKAHEEAVNELLKRFPHCNKALLFHEGYPTFIVPELRDAAPTAEETKLSDWDQRILKLADAVSKVYREKFPQLKIQLGNTTYSSGLIALLMRNKFPRDRFDCLGLETVGGNAPPEASVMPEAWLERETARKFGFDVPVSACYEFTVRDHRFLGLKKQAEWVVRDALICHGLGFTDIPLSGVCDPGNGYYATVWGAGSACHRYPLLYPKASFAASATLTKVLDQVRLRRKIPTGSHSVFALEFERGNETVYAIWVPRGEADISLDFDSDAAFTVTDLYGRSREIKTSGGKAGIKISTSATYLIGPLPNAKITVLKRMFPENEPTAVLQTANRMDSLKDWELRLGKDYRMHDPEGKSLPLLSDGNFELREADDAEKGRCLELELIPKGKLPDLLQEYASIRLRNPQPLKGEPSTIGVWVKGNSSWGRIKFEFEDAQGEKWFSNGTYADRQGLLSLDFDGWCFVSFPISDKSPVKAFTAGDEKKHWTTNDDGKIQYPIRLTGIAVHFPRKAINLTEMEPVKPTIRLKDFGAWE